MTFGFFDPTLRTVPMRPSGVRATATFRRESELGAGEGCRSLSELGVCSEVQRLVAAACDSRRSGQGPGATPYLTRVGGRRDAGAMSHENVELVRGLVRLPACAPFPQRRRAVRPTPSLSSPWSG